PIRATWSALLATLLLESRKDEVGRRRVSVLENDHRLLRRVDGRQIEALSRHIPLQIAGADGLGRAPAWTCPTSPGRVRPGGLSRWQPGPGPTPACARRR